MPRRLAFQILKNAQKNNTFSNIAIDSALESSSLSECDRALCSIIVLGVTERRITLDYYIDRLADHPKDIDPDVRIILEIGIYQILYLDRIPPYAAVNEAVSMSKRKSAGFVNAVLRNFMRKKDSIRFEGDELDVMSLSLSYPREICQKFSEIYGSKRAKNILEAFNTSNGMTLRVNTLKISAAEYAELLDASGIAYKRHPYLENAINVKGVSFSSLPHADDGYFFIQDAASQICVEAVGAVSGDIIIDACACPGSKSFGCAVNMGSHGKIISCDLHSSKLSLIEKGAARLGINIIETREQDGRAFVSEFEGYADKVICDVPCSGLGVMGKKPEIRYKKLSDLARLPDIQLDILNNASRYVKVCGYLIYSTCTVLPEENKENINRFLGLHDNFEPCDCTVGDIHSIDGCVSLTPDEHGTDGFFVCKMKRIK